MLSISQEKINTVMQKVALQKHPGVVLSIATARASKLLGLSGAALARTIGVSEPIVKRILGENKPLNPETKEGELALLLVRVFRSLDALIGTDDKKRLLWMVTHNKALGGQPYKLIQNVQGLVATLNYLDDMRVPT